MDNSSSEQASVKKSKAPLYVSVSIVILVVLSYFFIPGVQEFFKEAWDVLTSDDEEKIRNWVDDFGWFGPIVLILAMIAQMFLLVIPTLALMVVSILSYGPLAGSIIVFMAVWAASSVGYFIGRYFGEVVVKKLIGHKTKKKVGCLGTVMIIIVALILIGKISNYFDERAKNQIRREDARIAAQIEKERIEKK